MTGVQTCALPISFLIMPGNGSSSGCQFTGSAGAFTLSAAILANIGVSLAGCYAYFSANFGGSSLPAGWYWTEFSSDTAGIVYANTYTSDTPRRPETKTAITPNLSGWVTAPVIEITGPTGFLLPGNCLGKNGNLSFYARVCGATTSNKTYRVRANDASSTVLLMFATAAYAQADNLLNMFCLDSHTLKNSSRMTVGSGAGVGILHNSTGVQVTQTCDTSVDRLLSITMLGDITTSGTILTAFTIVATYGE